MTAAAGGERNDGRGQLSNARRDRVVLVRPRSPMQKSPPTHVHAIVPYAVPDPREERHVEHEGREQKKNRDDKCDEGNDE